MKQGALADYFTGVGTKVLKGTEVDPQVSRGHELQGVSDFRLFLGTPSEPIKIAVNYVWLSDDIDPAISALDGTWYNSRKNKIHRDPEYRLYYPAAANEIVHRARAGDRLFLCKPKQGPLLALFCAQKSSIEQQLLWLFGLELTASEELEQIDLRQREGRSLDLAARFVLEQINIEVPVSADDLLEKLLSTFDGEFPSTNLFSKFARQMVKNVSPIDDPDGALLAWMELEERLFRTFERHVVAKRLNEGFNGLNGPDVDGFVKFSLSVNNRRKSRAGWALGNHIEALLVAHKVTYKREATTEKRNGPDFLFPGEAQYRNSSWPEDRLTMLAAKTSCKDRWRQVLAEANRISRKHLLTLEPGISKSQTDEMKGQLLQLVIPEPLQATYRPEQLPDLIGVRDFLGLVLAKQ